jgi:hypothetical protein
MAKFRKKPVMIEAVRFFEKGFHTVPEDICLCIKTPHGMEARPHIHTLEGTMLVSEGDWVITGVQGEQYPCKPDIFEKTYEPVIEADQTALKVPNDPMLQFFMYGHLPPHMQAVSRPFCEGLRRPGGDLQVGGAVMENRLLGGLSFGSALEALKRGD